MVDKAHKQTDKQLAQMERKLNRLYTEAQKDVNDKIAVIVSKMDFDKKMTPTQRYSLSMKHNRLKKLKEELTDSIRTTNVEAIKIINGDMVNVYSTNYNFEASKFPKDTIGFIDKTTIKTVLRDEVTPFKKLAIDTMKDRAVIEEQLTRKLVTGIMEGDSIPQLAKRIQGVTEGNLASSIRTARTETTRVENFARLDVGKAGEKKGFKMLKRWVSTSDSVTRPWHAEADGQTVSIDKPFIVDGEELMYPGDPNGSAENVINCRCTVVNIIDK